MTLGAFEEFLYGAVLLDWEAEHARLQRYADLFDAADEVRIVGEGTDLRLSLAGRRMEVDAGMGNMPGGEFFGCPVETSAEGTIAFTSSRRCGVVDRSGAFACASPAAGSSTPRRTARRTSCSGRSTRTTGARRIGELGIGCNPGITRYMGNVYFDEKIDGTVHIALGFGFPDMGGTNESAIHWDIVKDMRHGGRIELDGTVVQQNGEWIA